MVPSDRKSRVAAGTERERGSPNPGGGTTTRGKDDVIGAIQRNTWPSLLLALAPIILMLGASTSGIKSSRSKHLRLRPFSGAVAGFTRSSTQLCRPALVHGRGPHTLIAGQPGDRFTLEVEFFGGARHLPIVSLKRAA